MRAPVRTQRSGRRQPVGQTQARHALELAGVVRDQGAVQCQRMGGEMGADWGYRRACRLQRDTPAAVGPGCGTVEVGGLQGLQKLLQRRDISR